MSDPRSPLPPKIDFSALPEPMRSVLQNQLARLPPAMRDKLLQEGSPLLERMVAKAREHAAAGTAPLPQAAARAVADDDDAVSAKPARSDAATPRSIPTVSPGDSSSNGKWLLAFAIGLVVAVWYALQG